MQNIFDSVFQNGGFGAMKVAPPTHKKTPKAIQNLIIFHHGNTSDEEFDDISHQCKTMSAESYEYSRLSLFFAVEHMLDELHELKNGYIRFMQYKSTSDIFTGLFSNMEQYFEELKEIKLKTFNKEIVESEIEAIITYTEGVLFLKAFAEKDESLKPLIEKYTAYQQGLLETTKISQKALKVMNPDYKLVSAKAIEKAAQEEMNYSMKFEYSKLNYEVLKGSMIAVGDKKTYWYAIQDDKKWKELYSDGRQALMEHELTKLREDLPVIFNQYKTLHHLSFTNMFKTIVLSVQYYGESMSARNEHRPKNEFEYKMEQERRDQALKEIDDTYSIYKKTLPEVQTPEVTLENLEFASQLIAKTMNTQVLLDSVCNINVSEHYLTLEKHNEYNIVKKTDSDVAIIFYENESHIYGCLIDVEDLKNNNIKTIEMASKESRGNSFISMSHFLKDIKSSFVQEYYFGKQEKTLSLIDKR